MADVEAEERGRGIESNRVGHRARNGSTIGLDQAFKWTIGGGNWVLKRSVFRFCSNFHKNHGEKRRRVIFINIPFRSFSPFIRYRRILTALFIEKCRVWILKYPQLDKITSYVKYQLRCPSKNCREKILAT